MRKHFIKTSLAVLPLVAAITFSPITASAHSKVMPDGGRFDATFYAATYPDVKAAFGTNENLLYQHYLNNGKRKADFHMIQKKHLVARCQMMDLIQFIMQKQTQMWLKCLETVLKPYIIII